MLTVIVAFNYTDRFALGVALQNIKGDLRLTDSELGFLSGLAFALFYSTMGIPIARWADRGDRVAIIGFATTLWSSAVAVCGAARSFLALMFIRVVVGVGEAGCVPPSLSLIAEVFERSERARAVSIYMQGVSASLVLGYLAAGWLNEFFGWRVMFVAIGLPGLILAALTLCTLSEPRRLLQDVVERVPRRQPTIGDVCRTLWTSNSFRHLLLANAVMWFISYGTMQWTPAFFIRAFGLKTGELGTWFALLYGAGGILGTYLGGECAARWAAGDESLQLRCMALIITGSGALNTLAYLPGAAPNWAIAMTWLGISYLLGAMTNGPLFAIIQTMVPSHMRAMSVAVIYLVANLIGIGLGPWVAGVLSDVLRPEFRGESLRYSMMLLSPCVIWGAAHLWAANKSVARDIETARMKESQVAWQDKCVPAG